MNPSHSLREIAWVFLKLGSTAFGGPAAHIAMMEEELVQKRKWVSAEHFLDLIGATSLIPGPDSSEMTMHCGYERGGWKGLIVSGLCFIFPAVVLTMLLAWLYSLYGELPKIQPFLYGIKPAVIAIILAAVYRLGKKAIKNQWLLVLGIATFGSCLFGLNEISALFAFGLIGWLVYWLKTPGNKLHTATPILLMSYPKIFWTFLKIGALLYGSGYVLFAFLDAELVATGWLTRKQLIDAVAVGQFTPGPVLTTATFIGWQLQGFWRALLATIGIFLPSFVFVLILNPWIPKMRKNKGFAAFLDAINVASVAVILAVCVQMGRETIMDWKTTVIAVLSLLTVFYFKKLNTAFIILEGATIGYIFSLI